MKVDNYKFGIFDVDGTLFDNKKFYRKMLLMLLILGFRSYSAEFYLPSGGIPLPQWADRFCRMSGIKRFGIKTDRIILNLLNLIDKKELKPYNGTNEVLRYLRERGIELFATTGNKEENILIALKKTGLLDFFSLVISSDRMPKREHIPYFARYTGLAFEDFTKRSFLVSDGPVDLILSAKYGVYGIGVSNTIGFNLLQRVGAKEVVSNLRELLLE